MLKLRFLSSPCTKPGTAGRPIRDGCTELFLPESTRRRLFESAESGTEDRSRIHSSRAVGPRWCPRPLRETPPRSVHRGRQQSRTRTGRCACPWECLSVHAVGVYCWLHRRCCCSSGEVRRLHSAPNVRPERPGVRPLPSPNHLPERSHPALRGCSCPLSFSHSPRK